MNKEELRALYKQIRLRMTEAEVSTKSRLINKRLIDSLDWNRYQSICIYTPIEGLNEVQIMPLAGKLRSRKINIKSLGQSNKTELPADKFDLILVPCLAFDNESYRLGWGGGFYDKFLAAQTQALKIGVCFQNGLIPAGIPREPHDIALDRIITEA